jgi:hypothetical protein
MARAVVQTPRRRRVSQARGNHTRRLTTPAGPCPPATWRRAQPRRRPATIQHGGRTDHATGPEGDRVADRAQAAGYEDARRHRVWLAAGGTVAEE